MLPEFAYSLPGDCWPTEPQTCLLRAALLSGPPALEAWERWRAANEDLTLIDAGSKRLLPLLYGNLRAQHVEDPLLPLLKAEFRKTWYRNQAIFHRMAGLLSALNGAGIPTLILKGAALAVLHYRDMGERPMADFDILVHPDDVARVLLVLAQAGWRCSSADVEPAQMLSVRHSINFASPDGHNFDLHWHLLIDRLQGETEDAFWAAAVPAEVNNVPTLALGPAHQIVQVCVHGAAYNLTPPLRWAADAMQVFRTSAAEIDWTEMVELAARLHLGEPLHDTLYYLRSRLEAPVPAAALSSLRAMPSTASERRLYHLRVSRPGLLGDLPLMWAHYVCLAEADGRPPSAAGFVRHLQVSWGIGRLSQAPRFVLQKAVRRLKAVAARPA